MTACIYRELLCRHGCGTNSGRLTCQDTVQVKAVIIAAFEPVYWRNMFTGLQGLLWWCVHLLFVTCAVDAVDNLLN